MATFPHHYTTKTDECVMSIEGQTFDVAAWRDTHPGGAELLDQFHHKDATDVFTAFHSKEAFAKLQRMSKKATDPKDPNYIPTQAAVAFRQFRKKLQDEGYFERSWSIEALLIGAVLAMAIVGTLLSGSYPMIASIFLGVALQQGGWLGHDYGHGRGKMCYILNRIIGCAFIGFSTEWWSHKHNTHHAFPNRKEMDTDIHNEPVIHLWFPEGSTDVWYRRYQYLYYPFAYSFLHISWRLQSIIFAYG